LLDSLLQERISHFESSVNAEILILGFRYYIYIYIVINPT